jgi:hypothetical protein
MFLVLLFGILLLFQIMSLPGQFAYMAKESPDLAYLRWPLTAVLGLLMVVLRALLRQATTLRIDMEAVI